MLVVDDDERFRTRLARAFEDRGYDVASADGHEEAMRIAREGSTELAVVDLRMPDKGGLEVVRDLLAIDPTTRIVVCTGYGSIATAVDAMRLGAVGYVAKPVDADEILAAFTRAETPVDPSLASDYEPASLARAEWEHISRVLSDCGGNISEAARKLGVHRRSLQRKLQKYPPKR
jgi:two-component system response regulator RegA